MEEGKAFRDLFRRYARKTAGGDRRERVRYVVDAGDAEREAADVSAAFDAAEGGAAVLVERHVFRAVIRILRITEGDDAAGESFRHRLKLIAGRVDNERAVLRDERRETVEGRSDVVEVLEEIQMVGVDVENDGDVREKAEETVRILAGFRDKIRGGADARRTADRGKNAADQDRRIGLSGHQDLGDHGGRRGLAVRAGDRDRGRIVLHKLPEERDSAAVGFGILGIVGMNGGGIDDGRAVFGNIGRVMADRDLRAEGGELVRKRGSLKIGTGHGKLPAEQDLGKAAHADAADADEMYRYGMVKIDSIHTPLREVKNRVDKNTCTIIVTAI